MRGTVAFQILVPQPKGNEIMKTIVAIALTVLLSACTIPYGRYGIDGGYTNAPIDTRESSSCRMHGCPNEHAKELLDA